MTKIECLLAAVRTAALSSILFAGLGAQSGQAADWSLAEAAKPYAGTTIRCMGDGYAPALAYQKLSEEFTKITGIKVEWEVADLAVMNQKMLADAMNNTGIYDCDEVTSVDAGLWILRGFVNPMHKFLDDAKLRDPGFDPHKQYIPETLAFSSVEDGKIMGLPYHFIPRFMVVRKDIHECPAEQAAFKTKYSYDLPLKPETWEQFRDVAEFFTRKAGEPLCEKPISEDFYGTAVSLKRYLATQYDFEMFLNAFGGVMFEGDGKLASAEGFKSGTNVAFDSEAGIKSLDYWLSLLIRTRAISNIPGTTPSPTCARASSTPIRHGATPRPSLRTPASRAVRRSRERWHTIRFRVRIRPAPRDRPGSFRPPRRTRKPLISSCNGLPRATSLCAAKEWDAPRPSAHPGSTSPMTMRAAPR